jgi:uncharacterized protein YcaQ
MDLLHDMRYLQLDPTSTVAPSHLLVLWSRLGSFRQADLEKLQWEEKKLFENWGHRASIVLTEDYPLYLRRMKSFTFGRTVWDERLREWMKENADLRDYVLREIRAKGPIPSRYFDDSSGRRWTRSRKSWGLKESAWGTGRDIHTMLEFLFHHGVILVAGRQGKQKLWDLAERWLPPWTPKTELSDLEVEYLGAQHSLKALGAATPKQISWHFLIGRYPHLRETLQSLEGDGKVRRVEVAGARSKGPWYIHTDDVPLAEEISDGDFEPRTTLLSPFDNLITDRDRTRELFDFFYRIEIYTPKQKRKHGFFVLPILAGDRIVGRMDPHMDREEMVLRINAVHAEPGAPKDSATGKAIASSVDELAGFLGAEHVVYTRRIPEVWKARLR